MRAIAAPHARRPRPPPRGWPRQCSWRSRWYAAHGVTVKATSSETSIASGTLNGIGRMYGPIMPLTKSIGRNETMTVKVARIVGGPHLVDGDQRRFARRMDAQAEVAVDVLDVDDRIVDQQAQRQDRARTG